MWEVRFYLFVAIPWNVGRILMSSSFGMYVSTQVLCLFSWKTEIVASNFMKTTKMIVQNAVKETASSEWRKFRGRHDI